MNYWFINCNKYTTLMQDVGETECVGGSYGSCVLSVYFFCKPNTALKNKVYQR